VTAPEPVKGILLDISGVLRDGEIPIPGSLEAFKRLKASGLPVRLVTNESQVTRQESLDKLLKLGYEGIGLDDISAPAPTCAKKLKEEGYNPHLLVHKRVLPEFEYFQSLDSKKNCVVIGDAAEGFTYENMNNAFRELLRIQAEGLEPKLFALGKGKFYKEHGLLWLDVGPFTAALEYAMDIKADLVGKPAASFFLNALKTMGVEPKNAVMIGDDIVGDVKGAQEAGLRGVLVRTGKFRPSIDENHAYVRPDGIVDNLAEAVNLVLKNST